MWDRMATDKEVGLYLHNDISANRSFKKREAKKYISFHHSSAASAYNRMCRKTSFDILEVLFLG
jgi:hypothetical protein